MAGKIAYCFAYGEGWVLMLVLYLTFFVIVVYYWFPTGFYAKLLASAQALL